MAELSGSTGSPDPQHPLNAVLFPDRAGFPHESPADPPAAATSARQQETAAVSPVPSPRCALRVSLTEGEPPELVHVPYIEVRDPDFVAGYHRGARCYFEEALDEEGMAKVWELTDRELTELVMDLFKEGRWDEPPGRGSWRAWAAWSAGFLAGLISARIPSTLPLYGNCPHCHQPAEACGGCRRCGTCTCPRPGSSQVAH
ncbi:MAG: hypothetical protein IRZ24_12935 [Thermogemmatispora sp.]|uniref:hypothetical protein n=1 Tax=Thermogemmatispora sp. TaxID=1968838 RepID=UPI001DC4408D|nr:hypothetical protein [Thermogemmatispora sp.]MBX5450968.1 hypothetical protein [Thermogemmatispora sp.]